MSTPASSPTTSRLRSNLSAWFELLTSMRFAISLLTIVAIASVIGTVLKQNEPLNNYLNQFGPFWFKAFGWLQLYSVYNSAWFLVIMCFLVASVSFCVSRNGPQFMREMRSFREHARELSLRSFAHQATFNTPAPDAAVPVLTAYLESAGFRFRINKQDSGDARSDTLIAAKTGSTSRLGYLFAHIAIVLICLGGLLDSDLPLKMQLWFGGKAPITGNMMIADVPASGRLSPDNLTFRANMLLPEDGASNTAVITSGDGVLIQDLPFSLALKHFIIEHYSTGQPKLFASEVIVTDTQTGKSFETRIEVNKPLIYKGIAVYQSSFDDGGTRLVLTGHDMVSGRNKPITVEGRVADSAKLTFGNASYAIEFTGFRPFNIENTATAAPEEKTALQKFSDHLGSAAGAGIKKTMHNIGPSFSYKVRDAAGQAKEFNNYMLPVEIDKRWFMMTGVRDAPQDPFRYLRMPLDDTAKLDSFLTLRRMLLDEKRRAEIGRHFADAALRGKNISETMRTRLGSSAEQALMLYAAGGYQAIARFINEGVPKAEQEKTAEVYLKILQGATWEAYRMARQELRLPEPQSNEASARFMQDALNAISDSFFYGAPIYLQLASFDEVKASVFQLTRSPGKNIVYLGSLLLVLGVFTMFYIRERRLWLLVKPGGEVLLAMSSNRRTLDFENEFATHRDRIGELLASSKNGA